MAAIESKEAVPITPGPDQLRSAHFHQNFGDLKRYLESKEFEPPK
jgi:hypothetical protein